MKRVSLLLRLLQKCMPPAIHNIKLSQEKQEDQFPPYPVLEILGADKVLARNHTKNVLDPKCCIVYPIVCAVGVTFGTGK